MNTVQNFACDLIWRISRFYQIRKINDTCYALALAEYVEGHLKDNFWTFWVIIQLLEHLSKI